MRGGIITMRQYLNKLSKKITNSEHFRQDISLTDMSRDVYSDIITMEFLNFYEKGAVVAAMLDIRLLELSNGTRGLREVFLNLLEQYGRNNPFPEDDFFEIFVENTYPEIQDFIEDYIEGTKPLSYQEYMAELGFNYIDERPSEDTRPSLGIQMGMNDQQQLTIIGVDDEGSEAGLKAGDVPLKIFDIDVKMENVRDIFGKLNTMKVGDTVEILVERNNEVVELNVTLHQRMDKNIFESMDTLSEQQKMLREAWSKSLNR